ncbi:MAG: hypothetical protein JWR84_700 [Caulobacter sp.]|nr:hypothetical protein [Caulobacter sp.]
MAVDKRDRRIALCGLGALVILALIWWINVWYNLFGLKITPSWAWALTAGLLLAFIALTSFALRGRGAGILIDARNRISLARFQALAWTIIVLSGLIALAAWRAKNQLTNPMSIDIPSELLAAMGIVAASLVASPALLSLRSTQTQTDAAAPTQAAAANAVAAKTGRAPDAAANAGAVLGWSDLSDAQWLDMFRGEEVSDGATADISKIQQFLITVTLLAVYAGALWSFFAGQAPLQDTPIPPENKFEVSLPLLSQSFIWLLGISHAGYLVSKALPSTPNPATPTPPAS